MLSSQRHHGLPSKPWSLMPGAWSLDPGAWCLPRPRPHGHRIRSRHSAPSPYVGVGAAVCLDIVSLVDSAAEVTSRCNFTDLLPIPPRIAMILIFGFVVFLICVDVDVSSGACRCGS
jgi:hypothetical protein